MNAQGSRGVWGNATPRNVLDFDSVNSSFFVFCTILKNVTEFHKTVETNVDPHLVIPLQCILTGVSLSYEYFCSHSMKL